MTPPPPLWQGNTFNVLKKNVKMSVLLYAPADAGREVLEPVQRLVHGGAGPPHPLRQRVLQQHQAHPEQNLQSKMMVSHPPGTEPTIKDDGQSPTRNRTYKQRRWSVTHSEQNLQSKTMGRTVKISYSRLAVQDRMVHRIDHVDLFSLYAPLFNSKS